MYEFDPTHFQKIKIGVHIAQAVCIFVSWAIEIAVFKAKDSKIDGRPGWYFGLVSTVPALSLFYRRSLSCSMMGTGTQNDS
jgi:hypothetical protein